MKKCVYPLVVYANKEDNCYYGIFPDLDIMAYGDTVEETFLQALDNLQMFLEFAHKMDSEISSPSTYEETSMMNPKRVVLLEGVEVDVDNLELTDSEQKYKNLMANLLIDKED